MKISSETLIQVATFHRLLFSTDAELLGLTHPILEKSATDPTLIAPLRKRNFGELTLVLYDVLFYNIQYYLFILGNFELAYDIMNKLKVSQEINYAKEIPVSVRQKNQVSNYETVFRDGLVIPCYSPTHNERQV